MTSANGIAAAALRGARVLVAGSDTMLGQALVRELRQLPGVTILGDDVAPEAWRDQRRAFEAIAAGAATHALVAAGRSGGIALNRRTPADLMIDNLRVAAAIVPAAHAAGVRRLLYVASSCIYPRECAQPMAVDSILTGALEPTSQAYAVAKLAALTLCQAYRDQHGASFVTGIAGDAYGPGDEFEPEYSHVVAGMIRRMHEARERGDTRFAVWGSGRQVRDLIYVDDLARACLLALAPCHGRDPINLSAGEGITIAELAAVIREVVGFDGELVFDTSRAEGAPMKVLDTGPIRRLGFTPRITLRRGIEQTYTWFRGHVGEAPREAQ